jgi:lipopolysaccharide/colanic/teichoic acid biosynthesis glycosyltransferase
MVESAEYTGTAKPAGNAGRLTDDAGLDRHRWLDLIIAISAIVALAPLMLLVALAIRMTSTGPVLFRQIRVGQNERPFYMLKFRTMYVDSDDTLQKEFNRRELLGEDVRKGNLFRLESDPRVTTVGAFLRKSSIDELPQLFNVLFGEMAIVGPRPMLPWEVDLFSQRQRRRHICRPGITGLWQVLGRNRLSMRKMLALDLLYVRRRSLGLDLWILMRTPRAVLFERATG